jgi:transcriptional regulator with XRE-family HTH domain/tetratricopeptide (TPR) repeat protein
MPPRNRPPNHLPPAVRDHPAVTAACQQRDLGRLFRTINNLTDGPAQFTATHIGILCQMPTTRIQDYMRGKHATPALETVTRVADGLRIPGHRFGLTPRPWETAASLQPPADLPIGQNIRRLREARNKTQEVIAGLAGIEPHHYGRIERGTRTPSIAALHNIARALETPTAELLGQPRLAPNNASKPRTDTHAPTHAADSPQSYAPSAPTSAAPGIGELIRTRRHDRGLSQDDLADALNEALPDSTITRNEISRYESEARMPTTDQIFEALARALTTPEPELRAATRRSWAQRRLHRYGPQQPAWKRDPTAPHDDDHQHLGERLAHLRRERNLTQERLAERAGVSVDVVRKLEQQRKDSARLPTLHKLATGLGVDVTALLAETPTVSSIGDADTDLRVLTSLSLAPGLPIAANTPPDRSIGQETISELRERTVRMRRLDDFLGGADTFRLYNTELAGTIRLIKDNTYTEPVGKSLLSIAAEQAQQAGWAAFDAGHHDVARKLYDYSLSSAQLAEDTALAGNALSMLSYQLISISKSGVEAASASCDWTRDSSNAVRALMLERRAFAYANAGDQRQTEIALTEAEDVLYQDADSEAPNWVSWADQKEFRLIYGRCWAELHRPLRAVPILESVLTEFDDSEARNKAVYLTWLASAYIDAGEIEQAVTTMGRSLDLSSGVASVRPTNRVALLAKRLAPHRKLSSVTDLLDRITLLSTDPLRSLSTI